MNAKRLLASILLTGTLTAQLAGGAENSTATLRNLDPKNTAEVACDLQEAKATKVSGRILTAPAMNAHNTFEKPETLKTAEFAGARIASGGFAATLPAKSVVVLELE